MAASRAEIEALYRERYLGFRRALASVTGSYELAEDVVQEAFARALAHRRAFRGDSPLGAWVWRIALRVALDGRRRARSVPAPVEELLDLELVEPAHDPELSEALRAMPPRRRLIFFLRYFVGFSYREIADVCGISEGTVAAAVARGRASVADALGAEVPR
jgi:RNA polymerase sigma-70 factor, ECF subfamily